MTDELAAGTGGLAAAEGGIYRVLTPGLAPLEQQLRAAGWRVVVLPEVSRTRDLFAAVRTALELPAWTGNNLDALWDVLTDLRAPTALVWRRYASFAVARPDRWSQILGVLEERAAQDPPFAVVLT